MMMTMMKLTQRQLFQLCVGAGDVLADGLGDHHELGVVLDLLHLLRVPQVDGSVDVPSLETSDRRRELHGSVARRHDEFYVRLVGHVVEIVIPAVWSRVGSWQSWTFTSDEISEDFIRDVGCCCWRRFILVMFLLLLLDNNLGY